MTIDEIREIVISPDALMKKEYGKILLAEIDRLIAEKEKAEAKNTIFKQELFFRGMTDDSIDELIKIIK